MKISYSTTIPDQLTSVADHSGSSQGFVGGSGTYYYDANGNLTNEPYKGFSQISYNALNRTQQITFTSSANRYITYTYDANGTLIHKMQYDNVGGVATLQATTDYIDRFVYITAGTGTPALSYFPMPEGRVLYNAGAFTQEFIITDPQGNARISFQNNGSGAAKVYQENSYYGFGEQMAGTLVGLPTTPNKQLYNGGSEWQNDYSNLPDYDQTFYRNYDPALGRWIAVDPEAESAESMTGYQYGGDNPIMMNDPAGNHVVPGGGYWTNACQLMPNDGPTGGNWQNNGEGAFGAMPALNDGEGLYYSDPGAYWSAYNASGGTFGGTNVYHAGNGTASDPSTGMSFAQMSLLVFGKTTASDVLAPYRGQEVWFSGEGELLSANQLNQGYADAIIAHQFGNGSTQDVLTEDQLIVLALSQPIAVKSTDDEHGGIDWGGAGMAVLGIVGGAAEDVLAAGGEWFSAGLSTPVSAALVVDGSFRVALNGYKLFEAFRGDRGGRDAPSNLGEVPGFIAGSAKAQMIGGVLNDTITNIITGGTIGTAFTIFDSDATVGMKALSGLSQFGYYSDLLNYAGLYGK